MMSESRRDKDPLASGANRAAPLTPAQKRNRTLATVLLIVGLVGGLAFSTVRQTTPAGGGASTMGGMNMVGSNAGMVGVTLRDIDGRKLVLPGETPGVVMFMARRGCPACVTIARGLARAATDVKPRLSLTLVGVDAIETREDFRAFDRAAGGLDARYALDDRSGSVAGQFGAREAGTVVVYDRSGMIRERVPPGPGQAAAVERAVHGR